MTGSGIEGGIGGGVVGFGFLQFVHGEAGDFLGTPQEVLDVDVLLMGFVAIFVLRLGCVFGDEGFDSWVDLVDTGLHVGSHVLQVLQTFIDVGRETLVQFYIFNLIVKQFRKLTIWLALSG